MQSPISAKRGSVITGCMIESSMPKEYVEPRNGGYYVAGTCVSLDSIVQAFQEGMSAETIHGEFDTLPLAQVDGALAYYLENQVFIDGYRARQERRFAAVREKADRTPDDLRQRIEAAIRANGKQGECHGR